MKHCNMIGKINSFQSLGTLDGPGIRFVVFLQGCMLRCSCCHNPDTWNMNNGDNYSTIDVINKIVKYKEYFNNVGGLTVSGGEPLLQVEFVKELFELAHNENINTCLDTSGCILDDNVKRLLDVTDYVLLDVKYMFDDKYQKYVGISFKKIIEFLNCLQEKNINTIIRQVIIPGINDSIEEIKLLDELANTYSNVTKVELLPFKKICIVKYEKLKIDFPFKDIDEASHKKIEELNKFIKKA